MKSVVAILVVTALSGVNVREDVQQVEVYISGLA